MYAPLPIEGAGFAIDSDAELRARSGQVDLVPIAREYRLRPTAESGGYRYRSRIGSASWLTRVSGVEKVAIEIC